MHINKKLTILIINLLAYILTVQGQVGTRGSLLPDGGDKTKPVAFSHTQAFNYLKELTEQDKLWRGERANLRFSLTRLVDQYREPFDSVSARLSDHNFSNFYIKPADLVRHDTFPVRWLTGKKFIVDTIPLDRDPIVIRTRIIMKVPDITSLLPENVSSELRSLIDSVFQTSDTISELTIDSGYLASRKVVVHNVENGKIIPSVILADTLSSYGFSADSSRIVISCISSQQVYHGNPDNGNFGGIKMSDSVNIAVHTLLQYLNRRDSILLYIADIEGRKTPFWLTPGRDEMYRYWVKNDNNDSITIWLGNRAKNELNLILEEDVNVKRPEKFPADDIPITTAKPFTKLMQISQLEEVPYLWKNSIISSVSLNQNYLSNWAKGGASSLASLVDITAKSDYINRKTRVQWVSGGRLRYGTIRTKEQGFRTSNDILEFNSQYNKVYREKLDFSAIFYLKSQVAKGYKYPNDSVVVSKFLNPGTFTIGVGMEYKPEKNTRINLSPLSYKNTFVLDTANILQTSHGIETGKSSKQEFGGQLFFRNTLKILEGTNIENTLRLFSNYLDKPRNVDVEWEFSLERQINWYFTIKLNFHLIYDDDIRFPVLGKDEKPVLWPDGTPRKAPRIQINQFMGLTLTFRL